MTDVGAAEEGDLTVAFVVHDKIDGMDSLGFELRELGSREAGFQAGSKEKGGIEVVMSRSDRMRPFALEMIDYGIMRRSDPWSTSHKTQL